MLRLVNVLALLMAMKPRATSKGREYEESLSFNVDAKPIAPAGSFVQRSVGARFWPLQPKAGAFALALTGRGGRRGSSGW